MLTTQQLFFWYLEHSSKKGRFWTLFPGLPGFFQKWTFINVQFSFGDFKLGFDLLKSL
jgi:hypothetical protein